MGKEIKSKTTVGGRAQAGGPPAAAPRAADVDPKQAVAPDSTGPVLTYEERRAAIRALIEENDYPDDQNPRTPAETEALIDEHMALEHLPGPVPEGKLFCVQAHDVKGQAVKDSLSEPMTHVDALAECERLNKSAPGIYDPGTWFGVTHAPVEAK